jgi:hypothetical protein
MMGIISSINAEWTQKSLNKCIKEIDDLQINDANKLKTEIIKIMHKNFDYLCEE